MKDELSAARRCINAFLDATKPDTPLLEVSNGLDEMLEGATKAIQSPDNQHVAGANKAQGFIQSRPIGLCAACCIREDVFAAYLSEGVLLEVKSLVEGGN